MKFKESISALVTEAESIKAAAVEGYSEDQVSRLEAIQEEVTELQAKAARAGQADSLFATLSALKGDDTGHEAPAERDGLTPAERFVKSAGYRDFRQNHPSGVGSGTPVRIEAKGIGSVEDLIGRKATITTQTGNPSPAREPGYRNYLAPDAPLTFLDLITTGTTDQSFSEYAQIIAETNGAAVVAEGALKPLSDVTTALQESKAFTYADGFDVTNQTLSDDGALVAFLESRIRSHVMGVVEQKLFNGTGAGTEPLGIMNTSGTQAQAFSVDVITTLARALEKFQNTNGNTSPQAIVMNSADIWALRLIKESGVGYMVGNPFMQGATPMPWGVPIVQSNKVAAGVALVGRFDSVQFLQLEALNVLAFNQHKDYAQRNMTYVRAEMRGRQLFYAPREVVVADLTA